MIKICIKHMKPHYIVIVEILIILMIVLMRAQTCPYLYVNEQDDITNQDVFDRFLTTLILSLVVCLANIGIALFGFLLFKTPGEF